MSFQKGLYKLLEREGWYSNDPRDTGGETYRGISRRWFPKWAGWAIVDSYHNKEDLKSDARLEQLVSDFYYTYFWMRFRGDEIEDEFIGEMLLNFVVNMGKKPVIKKVQRILKVTQDGIIGPKTIDSLNKCDSEKFVYHFLLEIAEFYVHLGKTQPHYLQGWLNRTMSFYYDYVRLV